MLKNAFIVCIALILFAAGCKQNAADTIYYNAKIYTCDSAQSWVSSIAVKDGKIIYAGDGYKPYKGASTQVVDQRNVYEMSKKLINNYF